MNTTSVIDYGQWRTPGSETTVEEIEYDDDGRVVRRKTTTTRTQSGYTTSPYWGTYTVTSGLNVTS